MIYRVSMIFIFIALSCAPNASEKGINKDQSVVFSKEFKIMAEHSNNGTPEIVNVLSINFEGTTSDGNLEEIDSTFYNEFLSDLIEVDEAYEKLFFYTVEDGQIPNAVILKLSLFESPKYSALLIIFNDKYKITQVIEVSMYEAYPGGSVESTSRIDIPDQIEKIKFESFVDGYYEETGKLKLSVDSIRQVYKFSNGKFSIVEHDSVRLSK